jgi:hypothetical protein
MALSFLESVNEFCEENFPQADLSGEMISIDLDNDGRGQTVHILVNEHLAMIFSFFAAQKDFGADEIFEVAAPFAVGINVGPALAAYSVRQIVFLNLQGWQSALRLAIDEVSRSADDLEQALHGRLDRF